MPVPDKHNSIWLSALKTCVPVMFSVVLVCVAVLLCSGRISENAQANEKKSILSVSAGGDVFTPEKVDGINEDSDVSVRAVYSAARSNQVMAYVIIFDINTRGGESFSVAVGIDSIYDKVVGVSYIKGSYASGNGSYILWADNGFLGFYSDAERAVALGGEIASGAEEATSLICKAAGIAFDIADVLKERGDHV